MNFTSSGSAKAMLALDRIQELYDRNLFLDAFAQTAEYWKPSVTLEELSVAELVLGGRLASRLGGSRLSRQLFKAAIKRDPSDPAARYFSSYRVGRRNYFHMLREFEAEPELEGADAEIQSSRLAYHAILYASLRDFKQAHLYISRAREHKARDSWVLSCESDVFGYEDRWDEALESAEQAWIISPGTPYAARSLAGSLLNLRRVQEAADRMANAAEKGQSHEIATLACWYLCALAETRDGTERIEILNRAQTVAERLESLAPLADRETRRNFALTRLDIAEMSDDRQGIERWAAEGRSPFHRKMLENFRANPQGQRIRLPFRRAIQKHNACLPTSLSSALAASDVHIDSDTMAAEITFGGTREWAAAEWLEKRGLVARFFCVTPEIAAKLIQNGIAFVMTLEGDFSAHAVAAVGLDEAAGTLIIHDPESFRSTEYLLESIGQGQTPLGPLGTVIVPPEKATLVDQLLPAENTATIALQQSYRRELFLHGTTAGGLILERAIARYPRHPVTQSMQAFQELEEGQTGKALARYQQLAVASPNAAYVRSNLLATCRSMQNTALMRGILADVVERGVLPGVESQQVWTYPPPNYAIEYADLLRNSDETLDKARSIIHSVIRRQPSYGPAWHVLADLLWHQHDIEGALFAYRVASCLNESNEHYATAFCDALLEAGREEEGLQWLENRVRTYGSSSPAVDTWVTWISSLERLGHPGRALAASAEGLAEHPESPGLLVFVVPFRARMGQWDEAEALLPRLKKSGNLALFREAAVAFCKMRGDLEQSIQHAEAWVAELPLSMRARDELVLLIAKRDGVDAAAALGKKWMAERPGDDHMEDLYYRQLERAGNSRAKEYSVLRRRVKRNPEDAWAWREMGFHCLRQYELADETHRGRIKRRMESLIAQCDRTVPGHVSTLYLHADWQQAQGEWSHALDLWMDAIAHAPKTLYGYEHAWDCVSHLDAAKRQEVWERMQALFLGSTGRLKIARNLILMAAKRFGVAAAEKAISHWAMLRPDDPGAIEAYVDLLLEHGHGRTDFERALAMIGPSVERFPYDSALRFSQADAFRKLGRFQEAEDVLNEIARRHPDNSSAQIQLARVQDRRGQIEEALQRMDSAIRRDPQNTSLFEVKIEILMRARRLKEAVAVINVALQNFSRVVHWRERSIHLLLECGDAEAAVQAARGGIVVYPDGAYLWLLLGRTLYDNQRFAAQGEIESILRQSLALNPGLFEAADYLALVLVEQRRYEEAADLMHKIVNRLDNPSPALGRVAWIHRQEGKKRQALTEMIALMTDVSLGMERFYRMAGRRQGVGHREAISC
jgi:tetratricopeptide (TPR) repeat protein